MKLRNKKTGMIGEVGYITTSDGTIVVNNIDDQDEWYDYESLAELNEEWEDYEGPEKYWFIENDGEINSIGVHEDLAESLRASKDIGNYFKTKEEAEKAVEKLKAWKRLKDKGFRFTGINDNEESQELITQCGILCEADIYHLEKDADFLLLFGGGE